MRKPAAARVSLAAFDAVLFDMDGTLMDTESLWFDAERVVALQGGAHLPPDAFERLLGLDVDAVFDRLRADFGMRSDKGAFLAALGREVVARLPHARPRPGAERLVRHVAAHVALRAVASNSPGVLVEATLGAHPWSDLVRPWFSVDAVERGKPEPDLYLHAARELGVAPARCLALEDSVTGATAAVRAGMTCIAVTFDDVPAAAFAGITPHVAGDHDEVLRMLEPA